MYICKMTARKISFIFIFLPFISFSQSARLNKPPGQAGIKNLYPVIKHHRHFDTVIHISYPFISCKSVSSTKKINNYLKTVLIGDIADTSKNEETILNNLYTKNKSIVLYYQVNYNKNGFLSLTIYKAPNCIGTPVPLYFNFDLTTGNLLTLHDLLNTRNDSISMRQGILPQIADSVMNFEQTINKNNPNYSDVIELLNANLATFSHNYPSDFILTDRNLVFCFNCFLPLNIYSFQHIYKVSFPYKTLRNVMKKAIAFNLQ